ncbi:L-serine dehydratase/L-threonine deaminase [Smittium mucronatum]|uniref:L-serine ammonia-lyase n=1 Tax=Smittium mucronatum TaxID=133383 RepID=A0A1R0H1V5_9FUNG|nr:L-serine dehydratase/L-threonine deaminase [Smittium mucronatum]
MQPTQSFRLRGAVEVCLDAVYNKKAKHLVSLGLTNESLAVAYISRRLSIPSTIFIPKIPSKTALLVKKKILLEKATIVEFGDTISETKLALHNFCRQLEGTKYISKTDIHQDVAGNAIIIKEAQSQLSSPPNAIIVSCCRDTTKNNSLKPQNHENNNYILRNLSLLSGVLEGLDAASKWSNDTPIIGVETFNSPVLNKTLGSPSASKLSSQPQIHDSALSPKNNFAQLVRSHIVIPISVTEQLAAQSAIQFTQDHQFLVTTGTALPFSLLYNNIIKEIIPTLKKDSTILVVIDGNSLVSYDPPNTPLSKSQLNAPVMVCSGDNLLIRMANKDYYESGKSIRKSDRIASASSSSKNLNNPLTLVKSKRKRVPTDGSNKFSVNKKRLESDPGFTAAKSIKIAPKDHSTIDSSLQQPNPHPSKMSISSRSHSMQNSFARPPPGPAANSSIIPTSRKLTTRSSSVSGFKKLKPPPANSGSIKQSPKNSIKLEKGLSRSSPLVSANNQIISTAFTETLNAQDPTLTNNLEGLGTITMNDWSDELFGLVQNPDFFDSDQTSDIFQNNMAGFLSEPSFFQENNQLMELLQHQSQDSGQNDSHVGSENIQRVSDGEDRRSDSIYQLVISEGSSMSQIDNLATVQRNPNTKNSQTNHSISYLESECTS